MDNPTGADNAQVQDAEAKAREIQRDYVDLWGDMPNRRSAELTDAIAQALREAERRGMMRARDIAMAIDSGRGNEAEIAWAIERAAEEG